VGQSIAEYFCVNCMTGERMKKKGREGGKYMRRRVFVTKERDPNACCYEKPYADMSMA